MKYDWKITGKKAGIAFIEVVAAGLIVILTDKPQFIFLIPIFEGIRNWCKNAKNK